MGLLFHHLEYPSVRATMVEQWSEENETVCRDYAPDSRPYGKLFSDEGWRVLPAVMIEALREHNDDWLRDQIGVEANWIPKQMRRTRSGGYTEVNYNRPDAARRFALTEFNTAYVRAVATVGLRGGEEFGVVYRAGDAQIERARCTDAEEQAISLRSLIDDHRRYFHDGEVPDTSLPIPFGPNCHHSVRIDAFMQ